MKLAMNIYIDLTILCNAPYQYIEIFDYLDNIFAVVNFFTLATPAPALGMDKW